MPVMPCIAPFRMTADQAGSRVKLHPEARS
jgi:hypothetical protein